ncbi:MAG: ABC transporter substrate-binding protein [bacterium]
MKGSLFLMGCLVVVLVLISAPLYAVDKYNEAPMLKKLVEAGKLPPVEKRLPEEPLVVKPVDSIGKYGGTLQMIDRPEGNDVNGMYITPFFALAQDFEAGTHDYYGGVAQGKVVPFFMKSGEFGPDKKSFTMKLRKGVKWSDGQPLTTDDFMFWWEDIVQNKDLTPNIDPILKPGGELMKVTKVDDYTLRFEFSVPYKWFAYNWSDWAVRNFPIRPKHYLRQFHIKYNPKANELAKEEKFDNWWGLFGEKSSWYHNPDLPTYYPFKTVEYKPDRWVAERNPYFWAVDTAGNQLPYIDRIVCELNSNQEVVNMKVVAGQIDYTAVPLSFSDIPLFKENESKGGYKTALWDLPMGAMPSIMVNFTYEKDKVLGQILSDVRFRRALSMAINRDEVNKVAYFGLSYPTQATVLPKSRFYEESYAKAWAEYSPEKANALLDEMGLPWDASRRYRLRPDKKPLTVVLENCDIGAIRSYNKVIELLKEYWEKIGIQIVVKTVEPGIWWSHLQANEQEITCWGVDNFSDLAIQQLMPWMVPGSGYAGTSWYAIPWHNWVVSEGKSGKEPPPEVKAMREKWLRMRESNDEAEITRLGKEIFAQQADQLYYIGVVGSLKQPLIVKNRLKNFPFEAVWSNDVSLSLYAWSFQWYLE